MNETRQPHRALAIAEEAHEAGVIGDALIALYREKDRAFHDACAQHRALLADYTRVRAGATVDDIDRQFVTEALGHVLGAMRELDIVAREIDTVLQAAYQASLQDTES